MIAIIQTIKMYKNKTGMPAISNNRFASEIKGKENNTISRMLKSISFWRLKLFCMAVNKAG
jgi:hypothetical protein